MSNAVAAYSLRKFGKATAHPPVIAVYAGAGGWHSPESSVDLTEESAREFRDEGVTMVRVRWHWRTHEVILRRYLGG
jgi:hypothetical protein